MSPFPEEQLDSTIGYFPGRLGQTLHNGRWSIVRKLGWGPRSSTWLVVDSDNPGPDGTEAVKIFTAAAKQDTRSSNEVKLLKGPLDDAQGGFFPTYMEDFYEESPKGRHLCLVLEALHSSVESLRLSNTTGASLPVHVVKKVVVDILNGLNELGKLKVVHGVTILITMSPYLFARITSYLVREILSKTSQRCSSALSALKSDENAVVRSRPMGVGIEWNSSRKDIASSSIYLSNFGYARLAHERTDGSNAAPGTFVPPEVLRGDKAATSSDIWALGIASYLLLTGTPLFKESSLCHYREVLDILAELLASDDKIASEDLPSTLLFLQSCLQIYPSKRASVDNLLDNYWVKEGDMCSCGWCAVE